MWNIPVSKFAQTLRAPSEMAALVISDVKKIGEKLPSEFFAGVREPHDGIPRKIDGVQLYMR